MRLNKYSFSQNLRYTVRPLPYLFIVFFVGILLTATPEAGFTAQSSGDSLQNQIQQEQARAKARRESLSRLTAQERSTDAELAAAEKRILALEESLEKAAKVLDSLSVSDKELQTSAEVLKGEHAKTEEAMTEVLRVLWELHARRVSVKNRDLPDWHVTDREHRWSLELFASLEEHRKTLTEQQKELDAVAVKRNALSREVSTRIAAQNKEKEQLLQSRVRYEQSLTSLRRQKQQAEEELASILALVHNLNLRMDAVEVQGDIAKAKGKLPWPVTGPIKGRFNPSARDPVRGVTVALERNSPVKAVHWGKVVHNDVLRGKGRVVILMHGEEYYSLYMFLSESSLRIGQSVARGEVVGTSGFVPSLNGTGLYFELRYHQEAINPEQWLRKP